VIKRNWRRFCLWFCQVSFNEAMRRGDTEDAAYWQDKAERIAGWSE
jgi:hypothetical protein